MPICASITKGYTNACAGIKVGAKQLFLGNWSTFANQITLDADREITDLPVATLFRVEGLRNSMGVTENPEINLDLGTIRYIQNATVKVGDIDADKHLEILGKYAKTKLVVFVQLASDKIICFGRENGCYISQANASSGVTNGDLNGYDLIFTAEEPNQSPFCEAFTTEPFDNYAPNITVTPDFNS